MASAAALSRPRFSTSTEISSRSQPRMTIDPSKVASWTVGRPLVVNRFSSRTRTPSVSTRTTQPVAPAARMASRATRADARDGAPGRPGAVRRRWAGTSQDMATGLDGGRMRAVPAVHAAAPARAQAGMPPT